MLRFGEFEEKFIASRLQKPLVVLFLSNNVLLSYRVIIWLLFLIGNLYLIGV